MLNLFRSLCLLVSILMLQACGGGGGGGGGAPEAISGQESSVSNGIESLTLSESQVAFRYFYPNAGIASPVVFSVLADYTGDGLVVGFAPGVAPPSWLSISTERSGTTQIKVNLSIDLDKLSLGESMTSLRFLTGNIEAKRELFLDLPITAAVSKPPNLSVDDVTFSTTESASFLPDSVSRALNFYPYSGASWNASVQSINIGNSNWLQVTPANENIEVSITDTFPPGQYMANITINYKIDGFVGKTEFDVNLVVSPDQPVVKAVWPNVLIPGDTTTIKLRGIGLNNLVLESIALEDAIISNVNRISDYAIDVMHDGFSTEGKKTISAFSSIGSAVFASVLVKSTPEVQGIEKIHLDDFVTLPADPTLVASVGELEYDPARDVIYVTISQKRVRENNSTVFKDYRLVRFAKVDGKWTDSASIDIGDSPAFEILPGGDRIVYLGDDLMLKVLSQDTLSLLETKSIPFFENINILESEKWARLHFALTNGELVFSSGEPKVSPSFVGEDSRDPEYGRYIAYDLNNDTYRTLGVQSYASYISSNRSHDAVRITHSQYMFAKYKSDVLYNGVIRTVTKSTKPLDEYVSGATLLCEDNKTSLGLGGMYDENFTQTTRLVTFRSTVSEFANATCDTFYIGSSESINVVDVAGQLPLYQTNRKIPFAENTDPQGYSAAIKVSYVSPDEKFAVFVSGSDVYIGELLASEVVEPLPLE